MYRLTVLPTLLLGLLFLGLSSCIPTPSAEEQPISGTPTEVISPTLPLLVKIVVPTERNAKIVNDWVAEQPNWEPEIQEVEVVTELEVGDFADIFLVPKNVITDTQPSDFGLIDFGLIIGDDFVAQYIIGNIPESVIATIADDLLSRLVVEELPTISVEAPIAVWTPNPVPTAPSGNRAVRRSPWSNGLTMLGPTPPNITPMPVPTLPRTTIGICIIEYVPPPPHLSCPPTP